jgi:hypothetical protein
MSLSKIDQVYLYTYITHQENEESDSVSAKKFLDDNAVQYEWLNYANEEQHPSVFNALNTWIFSDGMHKFEEFPFIHYREVHDDLPEGKWPLVSLIGLQAIKDSNIVELFNLGK